MSPNIPLDKEPLSISIDPKRYKSMIGYLLYLTTSRAKIMFSVYLCA